jgi:hypothetical protein
LGYPAERKPMALILVAFPFLAQFVASLWEHAGEVDTLPLSPDSGGPARANLPWGVGSREL